MSDKSANKVSYIVSVHYMRFFQNIFGEDCSLLNILPSFVFVIYEVTNNQSSCLSLKLNFSTRFDKLLFCFSVRSITVFYLWLIT